MSDEEPIGMMMDLVLLGATGAAALTSVDKNAYQRCMVERGYMFNE